MSSRAAAVISKEAPSQLRLRKSVTALTAAEVADLRSGFSGMVSVSDDRGFEHWAGIHGLPLPIYCQHTTPFFLPWHRAYLYYFEQYLLDQEIGVSLPWWDWSAQLGVPDVYSETELQDGSRNPLSSSPVSGIPAAQFAKYKETAITETSRTPGLPIDLPSADAVAKVLALDTFSTFTGHLEQLHDQVHIWVGGTMREVPVAAYDPLFWAHHVMIDRLWAIWQQSHPGSELGDGLTADTPIPPPFGLTVGQVLSIASLGYEYALSSSSAIP